MKTNTSVKVNAAVIHNGEILMGCATVQANGSVAFVPGRSEYGGHERFVCATDTATSAERTATEIAKLNKNNKKRWFIMLRYLDFANPAQGGFTGSALDCELEIARQARREASLDSEGYDEEGFNLQGYDREGYNHLGFNRYHLEKERVEALEEEERRSYEATYKISNGKDFFLDVIYADSLEEAEKIAREQTLEGDTFFSVKKKKERKWR